MDTAGLLSDEAFARRIAIGLLRDRAAAEDLVQEAWLDVLEHGPRELETPRGYLVTLLRRLGSHRRRDDSRRAQRERASARSDVQGDTTALVARAEIHGRTVAAVLALEEPYRSTILLRFFEDRTPAEIAAYVGIPLETARTRLKRALAMLRARLEEEGRDWREEWAVALAGAGSWPKLEPVPRVQLAAWGGAAGIAAIALAAWFAFPAQSIDGPPAEIAATETAGAGEGARATELVPPQPAERVALEPGTASAPPPPGAFLRGRVRDEAGRPLADVRVVLAISRFGFGSELSLATTDETGAFASSLAGWNELSPAARGLLGLEVDAWKAGHAPLHRDLDLGPDGQAIDLDLVLTPGRLLSGRVLDDAGEPAASAFVTVNTSRGDSRASAHELSGPTDREGWFAFGLEEGEALVDVQVSSAAHGFAYRAGDALRTGTTGDVALAPLALARGHELRGRCIHPDGTPVKGLLLRTRAVEPDPSGVGFRPLEDSPEELAEGLTRVATSTDEHGRFVLLGLGSGLFQLVDGNGPLNGGAAWSVDSSDVEIVIERRRMLVEVVEPGGRPLEEARVAVTRLSADGEPAGLPWRTFTTGAPPVATVKVEPGELLAVLALAPGCAAVEQRVVVPHGTYAPELRLALAPAELHATLALRPSVGPPDAWRIDLCAPLSGMSIPGFQDLPADAKGRVHALPAGSYRVRVEPRAIAPELPETCALDASAPIVLTAGANVLTFSALPAARVRILFTEPGLTEPSLTQHSTDAPPVEPLDDLEGYGASTERYGWMALSMLRSRGSLEVRRLGSDAETLLRRTTDLRPEAGRFLELVVPAVPARLSLVLPGREPFERELFLTPGETLEIPCPLAGAASR